MHYNRKPLLPDNLDPWESLCLNIDMKNLVDFRPHAIVSINGNPVLHQHEITFLTGASHCRAHAFAKMLTAAVIGGSYPFAQSVQVAKRDGDQPQKPSRVLWIDTVHSFYTCCGIIDDLKQNFNITQDSFRFVCLDALGTFASRYDNVLYGIINIIHDFKPSLVIIDDFDHLAIDCGINLTDNFYLMVREYLDHYDASFLCIGYNLIGRAKSTAGSIGKRLFAVASNVFRLSNKGTTAIVQRVKGIASDDQFTFAFNINDKNFPQELIPFPGADPTGDTIIEAAAVQEIFTAVVPQDEALTSQQLINNLDKHHNDVSRLKRHHRLIADALSRGILNRNDTGYYTLNPHYTSQAAPPTNGYLDYYINKLNIINKIPPIPQHQPLNQLTFIKTPAPPTTTPAPSPAAGSRVP
jgi:hypothetical protein